MENTDLNSKKIIDNLFDPEISEILAEMEDGPKHCTFLSEKFIILLPVCPDNKRAIDTICKTVFNFAKFETGSLIFPYCHI